MIAPLATGTEFSFSLYTHSPESVPHRLAALPAIRVRHLAPGQTQWVDQWRLPHQARRDGAELFFSPYYKGPLVPRMPLIVTVHDIMFLRLPGLRPLTQALTRLQLRSVIRRADKVITVSRFSERDLVDLFPRAAGKTVVLYSDMGEEWHRLLAGAQGKFGADDPVIRGRRFFLYVGNFKPHKNVDLLVRAFAALFARPGRCPSQRLVLVGGDDENAPRIQALIRQLGIDDRVSVLRDIDDARLSALYRAADWFVTASAYEGFGYPCVEAMVAGCPVICHQATSLIEVVGSAGLPIAGLTVEDVANALELAAGTSPSDRDQLVQAGRRQARMFAPGETAQAFAGLCRSLMSTAPR
jgi:glycosyltransferase involved in cell wall biosynthesis